jgi:hypothetical protein
MREKGVCRECGRQEGRAGLCWAHVKRAYRGVDPKLPPLRHSSAEARVAAAVEAVSRGVGSVARARAMDRLRKALAQLQKADGPSPHSLRSFVCVREEADSEAG